MAAEIIDWRTDNEESVLGGLKSTRYAPLQPPGRLFHNLDELAAVPAMTEDLLRRLRPHLCLYVSNPVKAEAASAIAAEAMALAEMDPSSPDEQTFETMERVVSIHTTSFGPGPFRYTKTAVIRLAMGEKLPRLITWEDR